MRCPSVKLQQQWSTSLATRMTWNSTTALPLRPSRLKARSSPRTPLPAALKFSRRCTLKKSKTHHIALWTQTSSSRSWCPPWLPLARADVYCVFSRWTTVYPIHIDAKKHYRQGCRRIARLKAVWYPLSKDIADAARHLGFEVAHEVRHLDMHCSVYLSYSYSVHLSPARRIPKIGRTQVVSRSTSWRTDNLHTER